MTTQDKINLIREKCIAANPEIVELKFGCVVLSDSSLHRVKGPIIGRDNTKYYPYFETMWGGFSVDGNGKPISPHIEILGRPIRLADVLLTMELAEGNYHMVNPFGEFYYYEETGTTWRGTNFCWNLRADDVEKQSEETISFLYDLLQ